MSAPRGHRVVEHTADEIVEAWGPSRAACLEEAVQGLVGLVAAVPSGAPVTHHAVTLEAVDDDLLLLDVLSEVVYLLDTADVVPAAAAVDDRGELIEVRFDLRPLSACTPAGPTPKGISHSGLALRRDGAGWRARALVDV